MTTARPAYAVGRPIGQGLALAPGWRVVASIAASSVILLIPVLLNGFPFIFPDSGDYLVFTPRIYRSPYYGLLIFCFHMNRWIWLPVLMQAVVVSHLLWVLLRLHGAGRPAGSLVMLSVLLFGFSSLPFFVGFIMADMFTPIMVLTMYLIGFHAPGLSRRLRLYVIALACVATAAHVGNLTMAAGLLVACAALLAWGGHAWRAIRSRLGLLLVPVGLTAAAVALFNVAIFGVVSLVPAAPCFMMANLIQYGPARAYLRQACPDAGYRICAAIDRLPATADELLWTTGLFDEMGGFAGMRAESRAIVDATIRHDPAGVARVMMRNFVAGLFTHEPAAEFRPGLQVPSMVDLLAKKFGAAALSAYRGSAEMRDTIPHDLIRATDTVVVPVMFVALAALGSLRAWCGPRQDAAFAAFILFAVLENTLLCTAASGVHDRYQARITWLLPMAVFIVFVRRSAATRARAPSPASPGPSAGFRCV